MQFADISRCRAKGKGVCTCAIYKPKLMFPSLYAENFFFFYLVLSSKNNAIEYLIVIKEMKIKKYLIKRNV